MNIDDAFEKFTEVNETDTGVEVNCCLGLWGVSAGTKEEALRQARHYFVQYWCDGEYDHLIDENERGIRK